MNNHRDEQMLQATTELSAAVEQISVVLATFAEALMDMAYTNSQVEERSREIFRTLKQEIESWEDPHGDTTEATR